MEEAPRQPDDSEQPPVGAVGEPDPGRLATPSAGEAPAGDGIDVAGPGDPTPPNIGHGEAAEPEEPRDPGGPDAWAEVDTEPSPRIYVASLGDLLVASTHGVWLDAAQEPGALENRIAEMLASSPWATDQWAIHGVEGFFGLHLSGFEDIGRISRLALGLRTHGEALARWVGHLA